MKNTENSQVEMLAKQLLNAKKAEAEAKNIRVEIEEKIVAAIGAPLEGSETTSAGNFRITLRGNLSRKADFDAMRELGVPMNLLPIKIKEELDVPGLHWLEKNAPDVFSKIAPTITTKPIKTGVTIKEVE